MTDTCTCGLADQEDETVTLDGDDLDEPVILPFPKREHHLWSCPLADPLGDIRRMGRREWGDSPVSEKPLIGAETEVWMHPHTMAEECGPACVRVPRRSEL